MPKGGPLVFAALLAGLGHARPALACDDGCDSTCRTCCSVWQVSAICGTRAVVDSSFARFSIADRVARSLNEQAASCVPSSGSCESARIECPGTGGFATWKATCEPEARIEGPLPTSPLRAELVQADRLRRAETVAIPSALALLGEVSGRADVAKPAKERAWSIGKELENAKKALSETDAAMTSALASSMSAEDADKLLQKVKRAEDRAADAVTKAKAFIDSHNGSDHPAESKADADARRAREQAERKAREDEQKAARAAEKAAKAEADRAAREAKAEADRAAKAAKADAERTRREARESAERTNREAREAAERADREARAAKADAERAEKAQAAAASAAAADARLSTESSDLRTDALATVARASSSADAALLSVVKLQAAGGTDPSSDRAVAETRKRLEELKKKLGETFMAIKATQSETDAKKQHDAVKKLKGTADELARSVEDQKERLKEIIQRRAGGK